MPSTIRQLAKHSAIYGLGSLLNKTLGFLLLPIYTRHLTPADYGVFALLNITGSLCGVVAQLGLGSALFREVIYQRSDEREVQSTAFYLLGGSQPCSSGR